MKWLKGQIGVFVTLAVLLISMGAAYGKLAQICAQVKEKADRDAICRELDLIHKCLERIEDKIDGSTK